MSSVAWLGRIGACASLLVLCGVGCESIAGIEQRHLGDSTDCIDYCDALELNCSEEPQYTTREVCLATCKKFPPGDRFDPSLHTNTLACRLTEATDTHPEAGRCAAAGPGGNGVCGSDCESYCLLFAATCPTEFGSQTQETCVSQCAGLARASEFNAQEHGSGDTLDCRLVHVSSAAALPGTHCPHVPIVPKAGTPCTNPPEDSPSCADYCQLALNVCPGSLAVYNDEDECEAVCNVLDPGTNADTGAPPAANPEAPENTVGCRHYHSYNAVSDAMTHCPHTGPTGGGHCGGLGAICESYCQITKAACPAAYDLAFPKGDAACLTQCGKLPDGGTEDHYSIESAEDPDNAGKVQCRVLHAVRALTAGGEGEWPVLLAKATAAAESPAATARAVTTLPLSRHRSALFRTWHEQGQLWRCRECGRRRCRLWQAERLSVRHDQIPPAERHRQRDVELARVAARLQRLERQAMRGDRTTRQHVQNPV